MFKPHPLAKVLPAMSGEDYNRLATDITASGLLEPITLYEGKVLDGINRQKACDETGVPPRYEEFTGDDPLKFVFSRNLARRHLNPGQLAIIGAKLTSLSSKAGGDRQSQAAKASSDLKMLSVPEAARVVGASEGSVNNARRVLRDRPDLVKDVKSGKKTLNAAFEETAGRRNGGNLPRRPRNWNGKTNPTRQREIRAERKNGNGNYNDLLRLSLDMNRACSIIEAYHVEDFDLEATTLDLVDTFHDDLITLTEWVDRALLATQAWLGDVKVRRKIDALRNTTGRTPEETENFHRVADRLEAKLAALLPSGV